MREAVHLVDATSIRLTDVSLAWADYEAHGALVKVHVDFDAGCAIPANIAITPARINDIVMAHPAGRAWCNIRLRPWIL
ncbi:MAG: hypothetical protein U1E49_11360 [Hyphomicrobiaceae bacterium]